MVLERGFYTADGDGGAIYAYGPGDKNEARHEAGEAVILPGRLLVKGTNEGEVVLAGADAQGVIGMTAENFLPDEDGHTPEDLLAAFEDGALIPFYHEVGFGGYGTLAASQTISEGALLIPAADGQLQAMPGMPDAGDALAAMWRYKGKADVTTGAMETARILVEKVK